MKIILSRKGFDSGYGGYPSPILPDGRMISLPIPDAASKIRYHELMVDEKLSYSELIRDLAGEDLKLEGLGTEKIDRLGCHLDPDIREGCYPRHKDWRGLFGQSGSSQSHLSNKGVKEGDLFLYFGWFRKTIFEGGKLCYDRRDRTGSHVIYGYLEVGEIKRVRQVSEEWMKYHPHAVRGQDASEIDSLYAASSSLSWDSTRKGYGTFTYSGRLKLTKEGMSRSRWSLPSFFKETSISYHSSGSWKEGYFQSAAKGQEFVIEATPQVEKWTREIVLHSSSTDIL